MKKKAAKPFPGALYVWLEEDGDETYPIPATNLDEISQPEGTEVGVYYLERLGKLKKTIELE